jgi:hypothetical protein
VGAALEWVETSPPRGIRRAFRANPGRELTTRDRRLAVQQHASSDTALNTTAAALHDGKKPDAGRKLRASVAHSGLHRTKGEVSSKPCDIDISQI